MRNAFAAEITSISKRDESVVLLSGDIGNRLFDDFKENSPSRFFNCGIAEANMTGVAAGMALSGLRPVTYTITPFNTFRCLEQIRVDVCYQNLPIVIVGVGAGLSYASLGATHHACEDIAILRSLPNMSVICPADANEVRASLRAALKHDGPVYIRLGKKNEPIVHETVPDLTIGKGITIKDGKDICLLSTGNIMTATLEAAKLLEGAGKGVRVVSMHTVKPLDTELLRKVFDQFSLVATIEEHSLIGGFGSAVAEWLIDSNSNHKAHLCRFGLADRFLSSCGTQINAREKGGLSPQIIKDTILNRLS